MLHFLFGVLFGFIIAYPLGLWAGYYTDKMKEKNDGR